jgi:kynureninase
VFDFCARTVGWFERFMPARPGTGKANAVTDFESYRDEFPVVGRKAYLISASLGPVSNRARRYLDEYVDAWAGEGAPDPVWMEHIFPPHAVGEGDLRPPGRRRSVRARHRHQRVARAVDDRVLPRLLGGTEPPDPVGARLPHRRPRVARQERRGAEVVWLESPDGLTVPLESYAEAIDERTAAVCINRVLYRSSTLVDAKEIARMAREAGAWSVVDDFHGAGIVPVDVHDLGCDFYTTGVLKWLCGGPGLTFLYARSELLPTLQPAITGWMAQEEPFAFDHRNLRPHATARRLESGTPPAPTAFIAQGGLDIITEVGPENIRPRVGELSDYVIAAGREAGLPVRSLPDWRQRGGLVNIGVGTDAEKVCHALFERDVCVDFRGDGIRCRPTSSRRTRTSTGCFAALREIL